MIRLIKFLRKPRWFTVDPIHAEHSHFQWLKDDQKPPQFSLSLLGVINGILPKFGYCLVAIVDKDTKEGKRLEIRKPWWTT